MAFPPKDVPPSELWVTLTKRPRPTKEVEFPTKEGTIGKVALRILSEEELHECRRGAREEARKRIDNAAAGDLAFEDIYRNELVVQLVCLSCRAVENPMVPAFPTPSIARKVLTTDEWAVLFHAYNLFRVEAGPMLAEMSEAEKNAWIKVLQEGGSAVPLARLTAENTAALALHGALLLASLSSTDNGSVGLQPETSSSLQSDADANEHDRRLNALVVAAVASAKASGAEQVRVEEVKSIDAGWEVALSWPDGNARAIHRFVVAETLQNDAGVNSESP